MKYNGNNVEIMAMSECPNHCEHCFINYSGHIEFDCLDKMMADYCKNYKQVILNGTELLINRKYIDLCSKYGQNFIYTNGKLLTKGKRNLLKLKGISRVSISLHYGMQEQISKLSICEVSRIIQETIEDGIKVRVLCTISKENYQLVPEIAEYVHSLGVSSLKFINLYKEGKANSLENIILNQEEITEFFQLLDLTRKKYDKKEFYITRSGTFGNDIKRANNFICEAGTNSIVITPDHKVYPCNALLYDEYCIGYWDETGIYIDKIINHNKKECLALEKQLKK